MPIKPFAVQRRMRELGRVRMGEKGSRGEPKRLDTFRFTSPGEIGKKLLTAVAERYGGEVREWKGAPEADSWEVITTSDELDIVLIPVFSAEDGTPTASFSQWFELWSGGGCQRRCDGETAEIDGKPGQPCACNPEERACKATTRVNFMLPDIPDIGVWRLESHGWNAASELPGILQLLQHAAAEGKFIPAVLRIDHRTKKVPGEGTRRFIVPVIALPQVTVEQLASGDVPLALNPPSTSIPARPALPRAVADPKGEAFEIEGEEVPAFGPPPSIRAAVEADAAAPEIALTKERFAEKLDEAGIPMEKAREIAKPLFPGQTPSQLNNKQRGEWWNAVRIACEVQEQLDGVPV